MRKHQLFMFHRIKIKQKALKLFSRSFPEVENLGTSDDSIQVIQVGSNIQDGIDRMIKPSNKPDVGSLDKDFPILVSQTARPERLEKLYKALLSIKPTSTACELTLSVDLSFKTRIRNRLSPKKLNALTCLKYYFVNL